MPDLGIELASCGVAHQSLWLSCKIQDEAGKQFDEVIQKLLKMVHTRFKLDLHHRLASQGAETCTAGKSKSSVCQMNKLSQFAE